MSVLPGEHCLNKVRNGNLGISVVACLPYSISAFTLFGSYRTGNRRCSRFGRSQAVTAASVKGEKWDETRQRPEDYKTGLISETGKAMIIEASG